MKKAKNTLKILAALSAIFFLLSCNPIEDQTQSDSMLIVVNLKGTDLEDNEVNYLQSDVEMIDSETGARTVTADVAVATLSAKLLNPQPLVYEDASLYNSITVTRYVVTYARSDGKNTEGTDIPYSFEGSISANIEIDATVDIAFIIVREVAKLEPPLVNLVESGLEGGDDIVLQVTARVDFYGHDLVNNKVKATGYLPIFFANYAETEGD